MFSSEFLYYEAMKSPIGRIEKKFRYQILMRIKPTYQAKIEKDVYQIVDDIHPNGIQLFIEVNPSNLS